VPAAAAEPLPHELLSQYQACADPGSDPGSDACSRTVLEFFDAIGCNVNDSVCGMSVLSEFARSLPCRGAAPGACAAATTDACGAPGLASGSGDKATPEQRAAARGASEAQRIISHPNVLNEDANSAAGSGAAGAALAVPMGVMALKSVRLW
jgi:hypothetical protein